MDLHRRFNMNELLIHQSAQRAKSEHIIVQHLIFDKLFMKFQSRVLEMSILYVYVRRPLDPGIHFIPLAFGADPLGDSWRLGTSSVRYNKVLYYEVT